MLTGDGSRGGVNAAINLQVVGKAVLIAVIACFSELGHCFRLQEGLTAKTRHHGHDENEVH